MAVTLSELAVEQSTYAVVVSFTDDASEAVSPDSGSITWTLTDKAGNVINSRNGVAIASATSITIVLSGDDLAVPERRTVTRVLTVECTYSSDIGSNLPLEGEIEFKILPRVKP